MRLLVVRREESSQVHVICKVRGIIRLCIRVAVFMALLVMWFTSAAGIVMEGKWTSGIMVHRHTYLA